MTPEAFRAAAQRVYKRPDWKTALSRDLGVNVCTVHRMLHRSEVSGPWAIAIKAMLDKRQAQDRLDREVRKLMPKKPRKRSRKAIQKRKQKNAERAASVVQRDRPLCGAVAAQPYRGRAYRAGRRGRTEHH